MFKTKHSWYIAQSPFPKKTVICWCVSFKIWILNDQSFSRFLQNGGKVEKRRVSNMNEVGHFIFKNDFSHNRYSCTVPFRSVIDAVCHAIWCTNRSYGWNTVVERVILQGARLQKLFWSENFGSVILCHSRYLNMNY